MAKTDKHFPHYHLHIFVTSHLFFSQNTKAKQSYQAESCELTSAHVLFDIQQTKDIIGVTLPCQNAKVSWFYQYSR